MTPRLYMLTVEMYITNVCNLACDGCNRFNNYKFKGFQRWEDYKEVYTEWAKKINFGRIGFLGGEPLLNVDILDWITGVRCLWPRTRINIVTNAYRLNQVPGLYNLIVADKNVHLKVGVHNKASKQLIMNNIHQFLQAPLMHKFDGSNPYQTKVTVTDANGVAILVEHNWWFHQGTLIKDPEKMEFTLYNSDREKAHSNCSMKHCYTFHRGELYKCGVVALLPEFGEQYKIHADQELLHGYRSLKHTDDLATCTAFVRNLPHSIEQCKFCPEVYNGKQIEAVEKKVLFIK
jgi:organic radical activating enzyme